MNRPHEQMSGAEANRRVEGWAASCPACGATARRADAHFCATCGRGLRERAYAPADSLLASYHQQHSRPAMLLAAKTNRVSAVRKPPAKMFDNEGNAAAGIALVLVFSALVPYIGIMFCPLAVMAGGFGLCEARITPRTGGSRLAAYCIVFAFVIAGAQILLWRLF